MRLPLATLLVGLLLTGVAGAQPDARLELRTPSRSLTATATGDLLTGPDVRLQHSESLVMGQVDGRDVVLTLDAPPLISGFFGDGRVSLSLQRTGGTLEAVGVFAGRTARLRLSEDALSGTLTGCQFQLQRSPGGFTGWRTCGTSDRHEAVSLRIPALLTQGRELDLLGILAVLLTASAPGFPETP